MGNRLSKIYTRTGDDGSTGLGDGTRVGKDSARVTAYGTVDEANSSIGVVLATQVPDEIRDLLTRVQHQLFDRIAKAQQQHRQHHHQSGDHGAQPALVNHLGRLQVHGGDDVPLQLGDVRQRQQLRLAIEHGFEAADLAGPGHGLRHGERQRLTHFASGQLAGQGVRYIGLLRGHVGGN